MLATAEAQAQHLAPAKKPKGKRGAPRKTEGGFDKAAYQRELMRKKRAAKKAAANAPA